MITTYTWSQDGMDLHLCSFHHDRIADVIHILSSAAPFELVDFKGIWRWSTKPRITEFLDSQNTDRWTEPRSSVIWIRLWPSRNTPKSPWHRLDLALPKNFPSEEKNRHHSVSSYSTSVEKHFCWIHFDAWLIVKLNAVLRVWSPCNNFRKLTHAICGCEFVSEIVQSVSAPHRSEHQEPSWSQKEAGE